MEVCEKMMRAALAEAQKAATAGDVPIGCVIADGARIVARGHNRREADCDPTAHAEVVALRRAGKKLGRWNLSGLDLYVTLEPCAMCAGAIVNARIARVIFGAYDAKFGCCGTLFELADCDRFNHRAAVTGGVLEAECAALLSDFFGALRQRRKEGDAARNL